MPLTQEARARAAAAMLSGYLVCHQRPADEEAQENAIRLGWFDCGWCGRRVEWREMVSRGGDVVWTKLRRNAHGNHNGWSGRPFVPCWEMLGDAR